MSNIINWYESALPKAMCDVVTDELLRFDGKLDDATLATGRVVDVSVRDSGVYFFPTSNWIAGWVWYYIQKANRGNFKYDIYDFDSGNLQYTTYSEKTNQHYGWHHDQNIDEVYPFSDMSDKQSSMLNEDKTDQVYIRKLSFSLQLNDDYEGGEFEIKDFAGNSHSIDKKQGHLTIFDSRCFHRVKNVTKGTRKSLVGWVVGPRWK